MDLQVIFHPTVVASDRKLVLDAKAWKTNARQWAAMVLSFVVAADAVFALRGQSAEVVFTSAVGAALVLAGLLVYYVRPHLRFRKLAGNKVVELDDDSWLWWFYVGEMGRVRRVAKHHQYKLEAGLWWHVSEMRKLELRLANEELEDGVAVELRKRHEQHEQAAKTTIDTYQPLPQA